MDVSFAELRTQERYLDVLFAELRTQSTQKWYKDVSRTEQRMQRKLTGQFPLRLCDLSVLTCAI